jgi:hypothetical protein
LSRASTPECSFSTEASGLRRGGQLDAQQGWSSCAAVCYSVLEGRGC